MTRFVIKSKTHGDQTITVDEADAYLLRSHVWYVRKTPTGYLYICRKGVGETVNLHRYLADAKPGEGVRFANGNTLDLRRANLIKDSMAATMSGIMAGARKTRSLYKLAAI